MWLDVAHLTMFPIGRCSNAPQCRARSRQSDTQMVSRLHCSAVQRVPCRKINGKTQPTWRGIPQRMHRSDWFRNDSATGIMTHSWTYGALYLEWMQIIMLAIINVRSDSWSVLVKIIGLLYCTESVGSLALKFGARENGNKSWENTWNILRPWPVHSGVI